ncbi:pyridoxal phosphate-dependent transferase [Coemansia spiralis]|nr:pyridoxal phosphate-dependent transferase [Coemansia spiralis]
MAPSTDLNTHSPGDASEPASEELRTLLKTATNVFADYVARCQSAQAPILTQASGDELSERFSQLGPKTANIWHDISEITATATNTWSDRFLFKLYAAPTPIGVVAETLLAVLNNNAHVFQASPVGAVLEAAVVRELARLAGFPETTGGLTFPGGSYSNIHALMIARNTKFPEIKTKGISAPLVVFTSAHAHYSIEKAAVAAGIGLDNVVKVPVDAGGRMDARALEQLVQSAAGVPFFVNATMGTTVLGAFDQLEEIARVCQRHQLWLHLDGSWGGPLGLFADPAVFSYSMAPVDSLTINPHKLLGIPLQCSILLVRHGLHTMKSALGLSADYLFHSDSDKWDVGDATLGCGRRPDAIKLWVAWRYHGSAYFTGRVNHARRMALQMAEMVKVRSSGLWRLVCEPASTCVCFWFVPRGAARGVDERWGRVTRAICERVNREGRVLIDYAAVDLPYGQPAAQPLPAFFRIPLNSPHTTRETLAAVLDAIEQAGHAIFNQL